MIRQLLFIAALLAPGLAYGGTATNTLNAPQVVDPPGSAPQAPAPAAAAGFTTCVVCMDFTASSGGIWINGQLDSRRAGQPSTWLDCAGANNPLWYQSGGPWITTGACPNITTDAGIQVLQTVMPPAASYSANGFKLYNNGLGTGLQVPTDNYYETTYIVSQWPSTGGYSQYMWLGGGGEIPNNVFNNFEFDAFEINAGTTPTPGAAGQSSNNGSNYQDIGHNWYGTYPPNYNGYDPRSQYHTVGMRITSDGRYIYKCVWLDNIFQNCLNWDSQNTANMSQSQLSDATSRFQGYFNPVATLNGTTGGGNMVALTKSINMWSCANWQTTACHSSTADPGGY
jgi:hypothetical protein